MSSSFFLSGPQDPAGRPRGSPATQEIETAQGYVLVAIAFQAIFTAANAWGGSPSGPYWSGWPLFYVIVVGGAVMLALAVVGGYYMLTKGRLGTASPVLLLLGILGIPFGVIITGIMYLLAWRKVQNVRRAQAFPDPQVVPVVMSSSPLPSSASSVPQTHRCPFCQTEYSTGSATCPKCGAGYALKSS